MEIALSAHLAVSLPELSRKCVPTPEEAYVYFVPFDQTGKVRQIYVGRKFHSAYPERYLIASRTFFIRVNVLQNSAGEGEMRSIAIFTAEV